jgi:hypothetical protein
LKLLFDLNNKITTHRYIYEANKSNLQLKNKKIISGKTIFQVCFGRDQHEDEAVHRRVSRIFAPNAEGSRASYFFGGVGSRVGLPYLFP